MSMTKSPSTMTFDSGDGPDGLGERDLFGCFVSDVLCLELAFAFFVVGSLDLLGRGLVCPFSCRFCCFWVLAVVGLDDFDRAGAAAEVLAVAAAGFLLLAVSAFEEVAALLL